jgi:eukaryotic-like serine/threonine-protein kinase
MTRNRGTEAESASAAVRTGTGTGTGLTSGGASRSATGSMPALRTGVTGATGSHPIVRPTHVTGTNPAVVIGPGTSSGGLHAPAVTPGPVTQEFVTLGRYQLLSRLAVGGMAEVYLARQGEISGFKTLVVVKKVLPHLASKPDFINMFLDEARIASMLDHPNVVHISEVGRAGDEYFLAMELVQGKPLASLLQHGEKTKTPLPHNLAALVVAYAAAGLHYAHQLTDAAGNLLGLVHRDVSPQNIMVSFEGSVKVIDFGIARALGRLGDTNAGSLKGKLGYMAPEQARGESVDLRADIFSLGVVLWECVAARRLFLRENELATLRAVVYEPIPSPSKYAKVDATLEAIIMCALDRNPEERFQSAEEMRVALDKWNFAAGGTSTHDLSQLMKAWFPGDHLQWQRAARLALDMQESDPPIDVAFPNLASRTGHSRTGTSRPEGSGSGPKSRTGPLLHGELSLPAVQPAPPPSNALRNITIALALAASIASGVYGYRYYQAQEKAARESQMQPAGEGRGDGKASGGLVRPTVEVLPSGTGTRGAMPATTKAPPKETPTPTPTPTKATTKTTTKTTTMPESVDSKSPGIAANPTDETGAKKKHPSSAEKRAIMRERDPGEAIQGKRPSPAERNSEDKSSGKKPREFRPNPF